MELIRTSERIESKYITNFLGLNKFIWKIRNAGFLKSYDVREVFSLYYDNEEFISINENLSGTTPRSKYRLRWYKENDGTFNGYQFQKKVKTGITGFKEILLFDKGLNILEKNLSMKNLYRISGSKYNKLFPFDFNPQLICCYRRDYYESIDGLRFTIDKGIKFKPVKNFNLNFINSGFIDTNQIIMELKFSPNQKEKITKLIRKFPTPSSRCSKYLLGHSKINGVSYV